MPKQLRPRPYDRSRMTRLPGGTPGRTKVYFNHPFFIYLFPPRVCWLLNTKKDIPGGAPARSTPTLRLSTILRQRGNVRHPDGWKRIKLPRDHTQSTIEKLLPPFDRGLARFVVHCRRPPLHRGSRCRNGIHSNALGRHR